MRPACEAFGMGIEQQNAQSDRREREGKTIQLPGSEHKHGATHDDKRAYKTMRKCAGRKRSCLRTRICGINRGIRQAVKGHRSRTRSNHGHDNPSKLMNGRKSAGG